VPYRDRVETDRHTKGQSDLEDETQIEKSLGPEHLAERDPRDRDGNENPRNAGREPERLRLRRERRPGERVPVDGRREHRPGRRDESEHGQTPPSRGDQVRRKGRHRLV
jgi:hypothetical protein